MSSIQPPQDGLSERILFVDDEPAVRRAFGRVLRASGMEVDLASGAEEAMARLAETRYAVVATDYRMPGTNGLQLVEKMREVQPDATYLVVSGQLDLDVTLEAINEHHIEYVIRKPWDIDELVTVLRRSIERHWERAAQRNMQRSMVAATKGLEAQRMRLHAAMEAAEITLSASLLSTLDMRGHETWAHCKRVAAYALLLAREMGLRGQILRTIERGALLHDIGKIRIPDAVLLKEGPLTEAEWDVMRTHPTVGGRLLDGFEGLAGVRTIVEQHHERWDGSGYPRGLAGEQIDLGARIFAVADALDALTSERPYRHGTRPTEAVAEISQCAGTYFDPEVVGALLRLPTEALAKVRRDHPDPARSMGEAVLSLAG